MTRGSEPGTSISCAHRSGTDDRPRLRAATAGNSASRSRVEVKMQLTMPSAASAFRSITSCRSSSVADRIAPDSLASTVMAPRSARSFIGRGLCQPPQPLHLCLRQPPALPGLEAAEAQRAERHALELHHAVAHGLEHPTHLALLPLADRDLDDAARRVA